MIKVIIRGNWAPYVGTDYCDALGIFDSLEDARDCALDYAYNIWEPEETEDDIEPEGPDYWIEEYDPKVHDGLRPGGGSFKNDFK
tara:strand:+ start:85 stop:339 length:255 start_codon:yes stop_codon:yes gene_type:complete